MDSSIIEQRKAIKKVMCGSLKLFELTGSRAYERFTGPQIRSIFETQREVYNTTERISLGSSLIASIFIGGYAYIDHIDGVGMNLIGYQGESLVKTDLGGSNSTRSVWLFNSLEIIRNKRNIILIACVFIFQVPTYHTTVASLSSLPFFRSLTSLCFFHGRRLLASVVGLTSSPSLHCLVAAVSTLSRPYLICSEIFM
ncbi:hypothetical protein L6452_22701 [Arctium lappa]|uniref:Uncharacterized protein n=1 Tax=Arctium lappa TaxID=4217 RepID=A0ACB9B0M1_ARCLA|nr:hypothetical protein L6452_22701 [Arctium lappa]